MENEEDYKELFYKDYLEDLETSELMCEQCGSWMWEVLQIIQEEDSIYIGYDSMSCYTGFDEYEELEEFFKLPNVPEYVKNDVKDFLENN